jgi:hypothetical protein
MFGLTIAQERLNKQIRSSRFQSANLAAQFNDVAVMAVAGQNVFMTGIQQGTQFSQVLNSMGGSTLERVKALGSAFVSIINPTSLMTIAAVAGAAALIKWGVSAFKARESADTLKKGFDDLKTASAELDTAYSTGVKSLVELRDMFGENAIAARELNLALLDLSILESQEKLFAINTGLETSFSRLLSLFDAYVKATNIVGNGTEAQSIKADMFKVTLASLNDEFGLSIEQASRLVTAFELMNHAEGPEQQAQAARNLHDALKAAEEAGAKLPQEMKDAAKKTLEAAIEALKLKGMLDKVAEIERIIAEIDLAANIDAGVDAAGRMVDKLRDVYEAMRKASSIPFDPPFPIGAPLPPGFAGASPFAPTTSPRPTPRTDDDWSVPPNASGGGADPYAAELEKLLAALQSREEAEIESFARRQEVLAQALEQRRITEEEYYALSEELNRQHADKMSELDVYRYGSALDQAGQFFGDMASALATGNERMAAIGKKFAAVEALINAWRAFNQVLADAALPWYAKIPAAVGVLAAGMNAVQAIKGGGGSASSAGSAGSRASSAAQAAPPTQTLNFTITNDPFGFGGNIIRQLAEQLNQASRNGTNLRARVV